jgi:peptidyl-tRNA hydrolase, PTH1 family
MSPPTRLFIASLGNPAPYLTTRHSAGHVLLRALQAHLQLPALRRSKPHAGGLVATSGPVSAGSATEYLLWQSPSLMNVSGPALLKAYRQYAADSRRGGDDNALLPGLVVLHDEMEVAPGRLRARAGNLSAKGHNGIKSVQQSLQSAGLLARLTEASAGGGPRFVKIGVGIGRPQGGTRDKGDVSAFVLGGLDAGEMAKIAETAGSLVELMEEARAKMGDDTS